MKTDMRTRAGREHEIRQQVKRFGGFSIFWITANQNRARAAADMMEAGDIKVTSKRFPWHAARLRRIKHEPTTK